MNRRGFLKSILAAGVAPYVVTASGVLMPIKQIARIEPIPFDPSAEETARWLRACEQEIMKIVNPPLVLHDDGTISAFVVAMNPLLRTMLDSPRRDWLKLELKR